MSQFEHLFSPIRIGTMTAKNRLMMPAMSINFGVDDNGHVTEQLTRYFEARAKGGAGLMLVGGGGIHPDGLELPHLPALWDDACVPALRRMTDAVRPFDAKFGMQLLHGGRQSYHDKKVAPSPIPAPAVVKGVPRELTVDEIKSLIAAFGDSARRCRDGGFDFVEIHAAHGYLINQFLSPNANHRSDDFGGPFENRIRFLRELFREIKTKCGDDFPVGVRINGEDYIENGWKLDDALRLATILESDGADYLHLSAGVYGSKELTIPSMYVKHGCFVHLAAAVKAEVSVPVVAVGRIKTAEMADRIIRDGQADIVAMGRTLIADPEMPEKARTGQEDEIRPCLGCCLGCIHAVLQLEPGSCVVNPDVGREYRMEAPEAPPPKTVLIAGGGPAGMAAARTLALAGHHPVICEEKENLGGLARLAGMPPGRGEVGDIVAYFARELERLKVKTLLKTPLSAELLDSVRPDAVILATGSLPEAPMVKGLLQTEMRVCTITDIFEGEAEAGENVLILGGSGPALMLADYLAEMGKTVTVLSRKRHFAEEMSANDRYYLRERLKRPTISLRKPVTVKAVLTDGVLMRADDGEAELRGFDTLVLAEKMTPIREAAELLKGRDIPVHFIGDAKTPRVLMHAIAEGEETARAI